ncbi:hypothetical protein SAMN05216486_10379 [bacterium JGI 053]|nr:hypothetical protein SAMN05216486_10379 [bacterium JGI 053]
MEISSVTLRVLLLFFPGVLCALVLDSLTVHRERTPVQFLTNAFALGMGSYLSLYTLRDTAAAVAKWLRLREPRDVRFFDALLNDHVRIAWGEIALSACMAVVLASVVAAVLNHKLFARAAYRMGISRKTGDLDVWGMLFNSADAGMVLVRDLPQNRAYFGIVASVSETADDAELLLRTVTVFENSASRKLYDTELVYLARDRRQVIIEPAGKDHQPGGDVAA